MTQITTKDDGRRIYVVGPTYPHRDALRAAGCKWDPTKKAWWIGDSKREEITALVASLGAAPAASSGASPKPDAPGDSATVAGRAQYKGRTYYVAGRLVRGRTQYDDGVTPVTSRDGSRVLLYSRDGALQFWASREAVAVTATYAKPKTIAGLARFAALARQHGGTHPDACGYCSSLSCSAAYGRGGLCDED